MKYETAYGFTEQDEWGFLSILFHHRRPIEDEDDAKHAADLLFDTTEIERYTPTYGHYPGHWILTLEFIPNPRGEHRESGDYQGILADWLGEFKH